MPSTVVTVMAAAIAVVLAVAGWLLGGAAVVAE